MRTSLCAFAAGTWLVQQLAELPSRALLAALFGVACAAAAGAWRMRRSKRRAWRLIILFLFAALLGFNWAAVRAQKRLADALPAALEGRPVKLTGVVVGLPVATPTVTRFLFDVERVESPAETLPRHLQLSWYAHGHALPALLPGQRWTLMAVLKRPHSTANFYGFDFEALSFERGVRAIGYVRDVLPPILQSRHAGRLDASIDRIRAALRARIAAVLPGSAQAGIVTALSIGDQSGITADDWTRFARTGTSHLVAISGLHIGLVAGFAALACGALWRYAALIRLPLPLWVPAPIVAACAAAAAGVAFAALSGFSLPAQRALWMLLAVVVSAFADRSVSPSFTLAWALAIVCAIDPWATITPGFWLSFGAVAVMMLFASARGWPGKRKAHIASATAGQAGYDEAERPGLAARMSRRMIAACMPIAQTQCAVSIGLVPLTVIWFGQAPLISPLANAFAIPWVSLVVTPTALAGVILPAPFDAYLLRIADAGVALLSRCLDWLAAPSWALWHLPAPDAMAAALAIGGTLWWLAPRGWPLRGAAPLMWLPLVFAPSQSSSRWPPAEGEFRVTVLDVGQGGAALVETAHHRLLFDAGPSYRTAGQSGRADAGARIIAPYLYALGIARLDALVISHGDDDHAGGALSVADALPVARLRAGLAPGHPLWAAARKRGVNEARACRAGDSWRWDGVTFTVLWPLAAARSSSRNADSCVLHIDNGQQAALLPGDLEAPQERILADAKQGAALRATLLIVPHHGSATSSSEFFIDAVAPRLAVFQVGYQNRFGHPKAQIVARYQRHGATLYRTDRDGALRFSSAGDQFTVEAYRRVHRRYWMGR